MRPYDRVTTESGTVYDLTKNRRWVRRRGGQPMRGDGKWLRCDRLVCYEGEPMGMELEGLCEGITVRVTTPVVSIERVN